MYTMVLKTNLYRHRVDTILYTHRSESIIYKPQTSRSRWTRVDAAETWTHAYAVAILYTWEIMAIPWRSTIGLAEFFTIKYCLRPYTRVFNIYIRTTILYILMTQEYNLASTTAIILSISITYVLNTKEGYSRRFIVVRVFFFVYSMSSEDFSPFISIHNFEGY